MGSENEFPRHYSQARANETMDCTGIQKVHAYCKRALTKLNKQKLIDFYYIFTYRMNFGVFVSDFDPFLLPLPNLTKGEVDFSTFKTDKRR